MKTLVLTDDTWEALRKLLEYSYGCVNWEWSQLTNEEKARVNKDQFAYLKKIVKGEV